MGWRMVCNDNVRRYLLMEFSVKQLDRLIQQKQAGLAKKVARKANSRNEEKSNEKNRQDRLSQSTSVRPDSKKLDLLL